ncbi:tetratricopeptide (TPR) repeat protein [Rhizobium sp. SG_E_25_P2]|uniref:tetratricopeptide repeat protein n=1 Tax=Rhizobium sp. SG_E_25_P2 TaxID=2879942 RepID=UPI0024731E74|nr:tetratricopeptide repeat protein [Rhizobium sp. SG_E_25_P2]MDH6268033.1 tetratricopeptide (TPR) repeat protein [Rhizobium sp. SG_E_25_P2]
MGGEMTGVERYSVDDCRRLLGDGKIAESLAALEDLSRLHPRDASVFHYMGVALHLSDRSADSLGYFQQAIELDQTQASAWQNYSTALLASGQVEEAVVAAQQSVALRPGAIGGYTNLGVALARAGRFAEAYDAVARGLAMDADNVGLLVQAAQLSLDLREHARAHQLAAAAMKIAPDSIEAHLSLGAAFQAVGRDREALAEFEWVLQRSPEQKVAFINGGASLRNLGLVDAAINHYVDGLKRWPDWELLRYNISVNRLYRGDWLDAWDDYELRLRVSAALEKTPVSDMPLWAGEELPDGRLLVVHEQGFGDVFQFIRLLPPARKRVKELVFVCHRRMFNVLSRLDLFTKTDIQLRSDAEPLPEHSAWLPLMSLPRLARLEPGNVPIGVSRFRVEAERAEKWRRFGLRGESKTTWRIGLCWQGNPKTSVDIGRSIPLSAMAPLAVLSDRANFISLQRHFGLDQPAPAGLQVLSPGGDFDAGDEAFVDTAAMIMSLDLVITSDTVVAHLAGLLGRPVWLFLKKAPDWRWGGEGSLTPWYPSMRLFRQKQAGDWRSTFEEASADLVDLFGALGQDYGEQPVKDGVKLHGIGQFQNAIALYGKAIAYRRDDAHLMNLQAMALLEGGRRSPEAARKGLAFAMQSVAMAPGTADYWSNLAVLFDSLGQRADARRALNFALAVNPSHSPSLVSLAKRESAEGKHAEALARLESVAKRDPKTTTVLTALSSVYSDMGNHIEAERAMRRAVDLEPENAKLWVQLGATLNTAEKFREAAEAWEQASFLDPKNTDALSNLGVYERNHGDLGLSLFYQRRAVAIDPKHAEGWNNLGIAEMEGDDDEAAKRAFSTAISVRPGYADAHLALGMALLNEGEYERGLQHYEWRLKSDKLGLMANRPRVPLWAGEDPKGLKILLMAEQGFGDAFQFCRYATWFKERGADKVYIACRTVIGHLLKTVPGVDGVFGDGDKLPKTDAMAYMMSMPGLTGMRLETIPSRVSYFTANAERVTKWAEWLAEKPGFRVGVVWQGNPDPKVDKGRSYPLTALEPLSKIPGVRLIALQKGKGEEQIDALGGLFEVERPGADYDAGKEAFADTAAMMMNLDLIVTSDTAVAHLAGALGRPCWVILKAHPEWRWLRDRSDSPWYPETRLFRRYAGEVEPKPFAAVMGRVAAALEKLANGDLSQRRVSAPAAPGEIKPFDPLATYNAAHEAQRKNDFAGAQKGFASVLGYKKLRPSALHMLGVSALHQDRNAQAAVLFREAEREGENSPEFLTNYSISLRRLNRQKQAMSLLSRAIAIKPTAEAHLSYGNILRDETRFEEAVEQYRAAIRLKPKLSKAHRGIGNAMRDLHRPEESLAAFEIARSLEGEDLDMILDHAHAKLFAGDFIGGFRDYEARWGSKEMRKRDFSVPRWDGAPAPDKVLLVHGEQGFGDNIQFIRFVAEAARRVGKLVLEMRGPLLNLFRTIDFGPNVVLIEQGRNRPQMDLEVPILSLPLVFGVTVDTVPPPSVFNIDPARVAAWKNRFAGEDLNVGLIWQGNPKARADAGRSPPLSALEPLFAVAGVRFVSLQKTDGIEQIASCAFARSMLVPGQDLGDFAETAAAILGLDLVVSSCTATLHLAASLGVPTFGLLKYHADWRWLNERSDSPWYPSLTLFRQTSVGDWASAVAPAAERLAALAAAR